MGGARLGAEHAALVRLVVAEQRDGIGTVRAREGDQLHRSDDRMIDRHRAVVAPFECRLDRVDLPTPGVAEPGRRQHVERRSVGPGVGRPHDHDDVVDVGLHVVDLDHPVAVVVERAGVEQFVLGLVLAAPAVLLDEVLVRERRLRIVVPPPIPGVARDGVEVPPVVLGVLAVVALGAGEAEHPLLEDRVVAVPQCEAEAQPLFDVGEPGHAVLAPAVGARTGVVVGEVGPRLAVGAVVLAHRSPLALAHIWPPPVPVAGLQQAVGQLTESGNPGLLCPGAGVVHGRQRTRAYVVDMRFETTIELGGKTATGFEVPDEIVEALGAGKRPAVNVTVGGHTYRSTVAVMGGRYLVPLSAENRSAAGVAAGDTVDVEIELDTAERVLDVPDDLAAAIAADAAAQSFWDSISYSRRRRIVLAVDGAKAAETRSRRIDKSVTDLRAGKA